MIPLITKGGTLYYKIIFLPVLAGILILISAMPIKADVLTVKWPIPDSSVMRRYGNGSSLDSHFDFKVNTVLLTGGDSEIDLPKGSELFLNMFLYDSSSGQWIESASSRFHITIHHYGAVKWSELINTTEAGSINRWVSHITSHVGNFFIQHRKVDERDCLVYALSNNTTADIILPFGLNPAGYCTAVPPADDACKWSTSSINLDFGTLNLSKVAGAVAHKPAALTCPKDVNVTFYAGKASSGDSVNLSNGMKAKVTVGNTAMGGSQKISTGVHDLDINAELSGTPVAGNFNASIIIYTVYD